MTEHPECVDISIVQGDVPGELFAMAYCERCCAFSMAQVCEEHHSHPGWEWAPTEREAAAKALALLTSTECFQ